MICVMFDICFFNESATTEIYTSEHPLSLHDALPICAAARARRAAVPAIVAANGKDMARGRDKGLSDAMLDRLRLDADRIEGIAASLESIADLPDPVGDVIGTIERPNGRSDEHTSELQSLMRISYAVFCLQKTNKNHHDT